MKFDLGVEDKWGCDACCKGEEKDKVFYPSIHVNGTKEMPEFPEGEFTATITCKLVSKAERKEDDGPTEYSFDLEVRGIEVDEQESNAEQSDSLEDAIEREIRKRK